MKTEFQDYAYTKFLNSITPFSKEMTLDGIKALLHQLGDFHETLKIIHIAGTNGKGSCVKMLSSIYKNAGYKTGTFTSPYIVDYRECIHIDDNMIDNALMNIASLKVSKAYQQLVSNKLPLPTHYECITVVALLSLYLEKVDLAIVEVLMGGLNDATNVFSSPLLTLITSISLDHTEYLGDTVELIAAQKAGIIKQNCPIVLNKNIPSVESVVKDIADKYCAPLYNSETFVNKIYSSHELNDYFNHLSLKGNHQKDNLHGVLTTISALEDYYTVKAKHIISGLEAVIHPCRIESITHDSINFIIDGSHNEGGIIALVNYIKKYYSAKKLVFILGMLKDKDQKMIQKHIYSIANQVILTTPNNVRKYDPNNFYTNLNNSQQEITTIIPIIDDVYSHILVNKKQATNTLFIACGSLYVSFPFRQLLTET